MTVRRLILLRRLAVAGLVVTLASLLARGLRLDWRTGDTAILIRGFDALSRCLGEGVLVRCVDDPRTVGPFPLLTSLPAFGLYLTGLGPEAVQHGLAVLNAVVLVGGGAALVGWCARRGGLQHAVVAALVAFGGILLAYTAQTFAEPLMCAAFAGVVVAGLDRTRVSPWLFPAGLLAALSKETAPPFVVILGVAAAAVSGARPAIVRRAAVVLVSSAAVGAVLNALYNVFRYGTLTNELYLLFPQPTPGAAVNAAVGMLVSPNAGVVWFWPGVAVATGYLLWMLLGPSAGRGPASRRRRFGAFLGLAALGGSVLGLALWYSPYGWYAWGPRLLIPVAAGVVVLALGVPPTCQPVEPVESPVAGSGHPARRAYRTCALVALGVAATLASAPAIGVVFAPSHYTDNVVWSFSADPQCVPGPSNDVLNGPQSQAVNEYCTRIQTWETERMPLLTAVTGEHGDPVWYGLTLVALALTVSPWVALAVADSDRSALTATSGSPEPAGRRRRAREPLRPS